MGRQDGKRMKLHDCQQPLHPLQFPSVREASNLSENSIFLMDDNPLGLSLRKSPSLVDLIQKQLSSADEQVPESESTVPDGGRGKLKAANCPALHLQIGIWQYVSCFDGNLVAKCYYAKRKLVWEILHGKLKRKMEIQWSDISALKAVFPEGQPARVDLELSRAPRFFDETTPQPRKHTIWRSTTDFTDGQATKHRLHSVLFAEGVFDRHFVQMLECDAHLRFLSRQTCHIVDSCFIEHDCIDIDIENQTLRGEDSFFTYPSSVPSLGSNILWFEAAAFSDAVDFTEPLMCSSISSNSPSLGISQNSQQMQVSIATSHNSVLEMRGEESGVNSSYSEAEEQQLKANNPFCNFRKRMHSNDMCGGTDPTAFRVIERRNIHEQADAISVEIYPTYRKRKPLYTLPREPQKKCLSKVLLFHPPKEDISSNVGPMIMGHHAINDNGSSFAFCSQKNVYNQPILSHAARHEDIYLSGEEFRPLMDERGLYERIPYQ